MKIKVKDFWEEIGTVFTNTSDIISDDNDDYVVLPKGTFIIMGQDAHGFDLYEIKRGKNIYFEAGFVNEEQEFNVYYMQPIEVLDILIEAWNKKIVTLSAEGWTTNNNEAHFNLSPYLYNLENLVLAKNILQKNDSSKNSQ